MFPVIVPFTYFHFITCWWWFQIFFVSRFQQECYVVLRGVIARSSIMKNIGTFTFSVSHFWNFFSQLILLRDCSFSVIENSNMTSFAIIISHIFNFDVEPFKKIHEFSWIFSVRVTFPAPVSRCADFTEAYDLWPDSMISVNWFLKININIISRGSVSTVQTFVIINSKNI